MFLDLFRRHPGEVKPLAARDNRVDQLLRIGRGQNEDNVLRRFFKGLQQRAGSRRGQLVHLIDDIDLVMGHHRCQTGPLNQITDIFHMRFVSRVDLDNIRVRAGRCCQAARTGSARFSVGIFAQHGPGQQPGHGCLAGSAGTAEKISVADVARIHRVADGTDNIFLAHDLIKVPGTVFLV